MQDQKIEKVATKFELAPPAGINMTPEEHNLYLVKKLAEMRSARPHLRNALENYDRNFGNPWLVLYTNAPWIFVVLIFFLFLLEHA